MTKRKVIIIDAKEQTVITDTIDTSLENIRKVLDCEWVESQKLLDYPSVTMLLDENAQIDKGEKYWFQLYQWVLCNKVVLIGTYNHEFADIELRQQDLEDYVLFYAEGSIHGKAIH